MRRRERVLGFAFLCAILILSISIFGLFYVQNLNIVSIKVAGDVNVSPEGIQRIGRFSLPQKYLSIDVKKIQSMLERHPLIYTARVTRKLDGSIFVWINKAYPLISVLTIVDGIPQPAYFDVQGVCIQVGIQSGIVDLPILSGFVLRDPVIGQSLPKWIHSFLYQIDIIKTEDPTLFANISELRVRSVDDNFKMLDIYFNTTAQYFSTELDIEGEELRKMYYFAKQAENIEKLRHFNSFEIMQGVLIGRLNGE